jgi:diacylglycerol kinase family enzyme
MKLKLILNRDAGTLRSLDADTTADELAGIFCARGHSVDCVLPGGGDFISAIRAACDERKWDAIVVGGGDGSVSAAAALAVEHGVILGILPLGTMNLFARALGIPLDVREAAESLATGVVADIDLGAVNGRLFTHHVALGVHPRMIRIRERLNYGTRWGKIRASILAWWTVIRQPPSLSISLHGEGIRLERRTSALLITNNPLGDGHLPYPDDLGQGVLGIYVARSRRWNDLLSLAARMALGEISRNPMLEQLEAREVEVGLATDLVNASVDGEIVSLHAPLRLGIRRQKLAVLKPRPVISAGAAPAETQPSITVGSARRRELRRARSVAR